MFDPWVGKIPWRRERLPTPVFWPGEFHGLYSPRGRRELDMTERLALSGILKNCCCCLIRRQPSPEGSPVTEAVMRHCPRVTSGGHLPKSGWRAALAQKRKLRGSSMVMHL